MDTYDLIIIGAGPAGITASVYAARKRMNFIVVTEDIGGQAGWSGDIENYTGYQFITGPDLVAKFEEHMKKYDFPLKKNERVIDLHKEGDKIYVKTEKDEYIAKTVIIASGKRSRELHVPGEKEFKNKGLTYCATCDAPLFQGKDVAVIGGGNSALDAAIQLTKIAKSINIVNIMPELTGDAVMQEKIRKSANVSIFNNSRVIEVLGDKMVKRIKIRKSDEKGERMLDVEGIFVEIGLEPNSEFVKGVEKNKKGEIIVDCSNRTSVPGIFAAGDVTDVPDKQIIIAAGDGSKASLGAFRYLLKNKWA